MSPDTASTTEALLLGRGRPAHQAGEADDSLVALARGGDQAAFERLYLMHRDRVYALCLNLCGNADQAQDLLQETFVRAYRALPGFRGSARFSTWLHRIAVNLCRDAAHRQRRMAEPVEPAGPGESDRTETVHLVRAALAQLKPGHRTVLALRYGQALSYQEIAEMLDWSLPRVKVTLHRAKLAFKAVYEGE